MHELKTPPKVRPVLQARSRKTLNALLDAVDRLLQDQPFESITVLELARAAHVSTGAFYARFASKEDLLPELYSRYQQSLEEDTARELDASTWTAHSMDERLERATRFICDTFEGRSWLLRAMVVHSRRHHPQTQVGDTGDSAQARWLRRLADCVGAAPTPIEIPRDSLEFALYNAITLAREAILFPNLPMATALGVNAASIRLRLPTLMRQQLGLSPTEDWTRTERR